MLVPLLLLVAVGAFVAVKLHRHRLDPLIDRVLYRAGLNNLKTIQRRVIARTSAEVKASITTTYMPTDVSVGLSSDAFEEIEPLLGHVVVDLKEEINRVAKERGFKLLAPPKVRIYGDPQLTPGAVHVNTQIAEGTRHVTPRLASIGSPHRPLLGIPGLGLYGLDGETVLGRAPWATIRCDHPEISREHLKIKVSGDVVELEDTSVNGTRVNGEPVLEPVRLNHGDRISIASVLEARFTCDRPTELWVDPELAPVEEAEGSG